MTCAESGSDTKLLLLGLHHCSRAQQRSQDGKGGSGHAQGSTHSVANHTYTTA